MTISDEQLKRYANRTPLTVSGHEELLAEMAKELLAHRAHKNAKWAEFKHDTDDIRRLCSLFTHDMARDSSTNGELALANAATFLADRCDELTNLDHRDGEVVVHTSFFNRLRKVAIVTPAVEAVLQDYDKFRSKTRAERDATYKAAWLTERKKPGR